MPNLRAIDDVDEHKKWIEKYVLDAFNNRIYKGRATTLIIENPAIKHKEFTLGDQKRALLENRNLSQPVVANIVLKDNITNKEIDRKKGVTIAQMPYHTGRNTLISNGVSYSPPANQLRLRPGAYTREKTTGEIETHFNLVSGTGSGFRVNLEPETGIFNLNLKTLNAPLYPFLKAMNVSDDELEEKWGKKIFEVNKVRNTDITKFYNKLVPFGNKVTDPNKQIEAIVNVFEKAKMDPDVTKRTLGKPIETANKDALLEATQKIIKVSKGEIDPDDRDSLLYKKIYSAEDFYKEKVLKDAGHLGKKLMIRLDKKRSLDAFPSGYFSRQLWGTIKSDPSVSPTGTLAQPIEEINPIDLYDQHHKVTLLGEGGITDMASVTMEARNVHPSEFGFIDNIRTPESAHVGIDKRLTLGVKKGDDNLLYRKFINAKTGKEEWLNPLQSSDAVVAMPGEWESKKKELDVMNKSKLEIVPRNKVDYYLKYPSQQFSLYDKMVPFSQSIQGNRMILAGKAIALTMPLKEGDAPLVQNLNPETGKSFELDVADKVVNKRAKVDGIVHKITDSDLFIKTDKGDIIRHGLFNNFPLNLKTSISHNILVKLGDRVKAGDLLANSNYSAKDGVLAIGKNLKIGYMPFKNWNFEDGIVISESAAKKLTSEQMYSYEYDLDDPVNKFVDKNKFKSMYPTFYTQDKLNKITEHGVVKPGTVVQPGDPLVLAMEKRLPSAKDIQLGNLHKALRGNLENNAIEWDHHSDGVVTDVVHSDKHVKVFVKTNTPAHIGDKLTARFGNKGIISLILPDDQMPKIKKTGEPLEIITTPVSIPSRINLGQLHEAVLGKIVKETGKEPYVVPSGMSTELIKYVEDEGKKHNVKFEDDLEYEGRTIPQVLNGYTHIWKLSKMSEGEMKKREMGGYDIDQQPIKGKGEGAQALRMGSMELNAMVGHGAKENLREMSILKGQKNDEFWRVYKLGGTPPTPGVPFVYNKFMALLRGAGINTKKDGTQVHLMPLTDRDTLNSSSGAIEKEEIVYSKNMEPVKGGLFDPGLTGGFAGTKWNHVKLAEPIPNPIMEEPIKKLLRINAVEFDNKLKFGTLGKDLENIDTEPVDIYALPASKRDLEIRRMKYINAMNKNGIKPKDLLISTVPVIPPIYRPISIVGTKNNVEPGNANLLYKDLMTVNKALQGNKQDFVSEDLGLERLNLYNATKAVYGLGDPVNVKNKVKGATGFIEFLSGDQPKTGYFQKKVFNKTQDLVSRAVAAPDPTLSLDQISIPIDAAWEMYKPHVARRMVQQGIGQDVKGASQIYKEIENRTPRAFKYLESEMAVRPALMNRNPTLHKFNIMALKPVLNNDNVVKVSPPIVTGFNLDFDGDQVNLHVPVTPEAVREANEKLLPSKNLLFLKDRQVHYLPSQGTILGLYAISQPAEKKSVVKKYNNMKELQEDFNKGIIKPTDMVSVKK